MTKALKLIHDSAFDPDLVALMGDVFEEAWSEIAPQFAHESRASVEEARTLLARAVIQSASSGITDRPLLKSAALETFRRAYPKK
jgi:hypothetical protein